MYFVAVTLMFMYTNLVQLGLPSFLPPLPPPIPRHPSFSSLSLPHSLLSQGNKGKRVKPARSPLSHPCPCRPNWWQARRDRRRGWSQIFFSTVSATSGDLEDISSCHNHSHVGFMFLCARTVSVIIYCVTITTVTLTIICIHVQ